MSTVKPHEDDSNPFRPPAAPLEVATPDTPFFSASTTKFVVMSLGTFSIYTLYWFYRNFAAIRARTGAPIMPLLRTIFSVIWSYSCFRPIAHASGKRHPAGILAVVYGLLSACAWLPDPLWLVSFSAIAPVALANRWAAEANGRAAPEALENGSFGAGNWIALAIGVPLGILAVIGAFLPPP